MKLSAVAAFLVPPRQVIESPKAAGTSAVNGATVERTTAIQDTLQWSPEALKQLRSADFADFAAEQADRTAPIAAEEPAPDTTAPEKATEESPEGSAEQLTDEQETQVTELKQRDAEVRAHEQAHVAAGGAYVTGGPTYEFQEGPDGRQYAVGGEVQIDTSPVDGDPEATIQKAQVVRAAALAPAEPSSQDRAVAAAAAQMAMQAQAELRGPSPESESTEGETGQSSAEPTDGDTVKPQTALTQTYAQKAITKAIAAHLKTPASSLIDAYA